jgi:hypothetical protein
MQLLLGAYNSWGEAATPFKQTKRTHNRQVIQFPVWWAPGKSVLNPGTSKALVTATYRKDALLWYLYRDPLQYEQYRDRHEARCVEKDLADWLATLSL